MSKKNTQTGALLHLHGSGGGMQLRESGGVVVSVAVDVVCVEVVVVGSVVVEAVVVVMSTVVVVSVGPVGDSVTKYYWDLLRLPQIGLLSIEI